MTKFLKQTCTYSAAVRDGNGAVVFNRYGEPEYSAEVVIPCRREMTTKDVLTSTGSVLRSAYVYYLDDAQTIFADDKLDGKIVLIVKEYTNERGTTEGFECHA